MDVFSEAKAADLPAMTGFLGRRSGGEVMSPCCDGKTAHLSLTDDFVWRWRCDGCRKGGSAVDYVGLVKGQPPLRAARAVYAIMEANPELRMLGSTVRKQADVAACAEVARAISVRNTIDPDVRFYLERRGIDRHTIGQAVSEGWMRTLPGDPALATEWLLGALGRDTLLAAGMMAGGMIPAASMPIVFLTADRSASDFRSISVRRRGVVKALQVGRAEAPVCAPASGFVAQRAVLVAGGMEMLAILSVGYIEGTDAVLGECGAGSLRSSWMDWMAKELPVVDRTVLAMNRDRHVARERCTLEIAGYKVSSLPFEDDCVDWGDVARRQKNVQQHVA